jgi:hypothetical protein
LSQGEWELRQNGIGGANYCKGASRQGRPFRFLS